MGLPGEFKCPGIEKSVRFEERLDMERIFTDSDYIVKLAVQVREKEKSRFLKLPVVYNFESVYFGGTIMQTSEGNVTSRYRYKELSELEQVFCIKYDEQKFIALYNAIEKAEALGIVQLRVQGAFSVLCSLIDPIQVLKALKKHRDYIVRLLEHITEVLFEYVKEVLRKGVSILSYADPVGVIELIGNAEYKRTVGKLTYLFLKRLEPYLKHTVIHLCGKSSLGLENGGYLQVKPLLTGRMNYGNAVINAIDDSAVRFIGHGCINCEERSIDYLYLAELVRDIGLVEEMQESDKEQVLRIYEEAIRSGKSTVLTEVPEWEQWDKEHYKGNRYVYKVNGQVVGFAVLGAVKFGHGGPDEAESSVYVDEHFRKLGVGSALLDKIIGDAGGYYNLVKVHIFSDNTASIRLHEKIGFLKGEQSKEWVDQKGLRREIYVYERKTIV